MDTITSGLPSFTVSMCRMGFQGALANEGDRMSEREGESDIKTLPGVDDMLGKKTTNGESRGILAEWGIGPTVAGCLLGSHYMLHLCCLHAFT